MQFSGQKEVAKVGQAKCVRFSCMTALIFMALPLMACEHYSFRPYDYKKNEHAKLKKNNSPYSFGLDGKRLVIKKELSSAK